MKRNLALALALVLAGAGGALAQIATGNIYGTVTDQQGAVLPGAAVTLSGDLGTRTVTSSAGGEFRFLNLDSGRYKLSISLQGFGTVTREVVVTTGENVNLPFSLKVASMQETVEVTARDPARRREEARDVDHHDHRRAAEDAERARPVGRPRRTSRESMLDRMNIAGNENGQQANAGAKGSIEADKMWNIDGLVVTDMTATGGSPTYFDFDAFQEINVTTGGADLQVQIRRHRHQPRDEARHEPLPRRRTGAS